MGTIIGFFKKIFKASNPRYHLSLDGNYYDIKLKKIIYRFKVFGDHSFIKFSFDDIKKSQQLLYDIHPNDLINIVWMDSDQRERRTRIKIKEMLRNNHYKLHSELYEETISGDDVCENPILMQQIRSIDLYKISYNTGFIHGRSFSKKIVETANSKEEVSNVIPFHKY
jgi:hypothetical protein